MINQKKFVLRLKKIMAYYNENATSFSEKIGVQRSSISHILSERNKPSLEFILKVLFLLSRNQPLLVVKWTRRVFNEPIKPS